MTWNVWWRFGDWERREQAIVRVIEESSPDILGLQEVWATPEDNQAERLAGQLGLFWAWAASPAPERFQRRIGDATIQVGNAVLSRWPIVSSVSRSLPGSSVDEGRTALITLVDAPSAPIPFVTTQLASTVGQSALRCAQVRALTRYLIDEVQDTNPILTGDLNAEPDSDEVRLLGGHKTAPAVPGLALLDAWRYAEPDVRQWTWDRRNPAVRATGEPNARIDYIFVGYRPSTPPTLYVRTARLAGDAPSDGVWPSDHAAVVADLDGRGFNAESVGTYE